ncbi:peptidase U32 family protein [Shewanella youngdeokensis]|uniref:Peptidase U32 family protein n=1 Tax=Shewanella youngdeokensis TaxID=2999068 RepID=A0ABZ0K2U7_9GAMM|nr:peptidase U32 family protein [Shewanella sp. DAU334]
MRKIELLAPGGDIESIKAAIVAGADAVYCGLDNFNARKRAENLNFDQLCGLLRVAHQHDCQLFLTLNIIVLEHELPALFKLLNQLVNTDIDGVIVQDLGVFEIIKRYFPTLDVHASTQLTTHNTGQLSFLNEMGATRANLSRELNLTEIKQLSNKAHELNMLTEVFVHGSNCIGFSGLCYFSSAHGGNSGNRGRCSQPCRDQYQRTEVGADFPLNLKDNSAFDDLEALVDAGVDSLKVEGRIKKSHYVYSVINTWRQQLTSLQQQQRLSTDKTALYTVFNRDFTNGYLSGTVGKSMYIDNPRDNAVQHFSRLTAGQKNPNDAQIQSVKQRLYDDKTVIINTVAQQIAALDISKPSIELKITGDLLQPLRIDVYKTGSDVASFSVTSTSSLTAPDKYVMTKQELSQRFAMNSSHFTLSTIDCDTLAESIYLPFKELTTMKLAIMTYLNGNKTIIKPIEFADIRRQRQANQVSNTVKTSSASTQTTSVSELSTDADNKTQLSVLISNRRDLVLYQQLKLTNALKNVRFYYAIPDAIEPEADKLVTLFNSNPELIPWFGAIVMQPDFEVVENLLKHIPQQLIVSNNTGIGFVAFKQGIKWIAGPHLNTSNSFALDSLQQQGCVGAYLSNELNSQQIKAIKPPENFTLHYSALHPILLMTSRQCLFLQTTGCDKTIMDQACLSVCKKHASMTNIKGIDFIIDKKRREHNNLIGAEHFFNPEIVTDLPQQFDHVMLDLRGIETHSQFTWTKAELINKFTALLEQPFVSQPTEAIKTQSDRRNKVIDPRVTALHSALSSSTRAQYLKGL